MALRLISQAFNILGTVKPHFSGLHLAHSFLCNTFMRSILELVPPTQIILGPII